MPSKQFTAADRTALAEVGKVLSQHAEAFGAESLARLFLTHPASKIYFSEFTDYSAAGPRVRVHGAKVLGAVAKAIGHLDDLHTHLEPLAAKHGHDLVVDPQNFPVPDVWSHPQEPQNASDNKKREACLRKHCHTRLVHQAKT
ncbi:hemoglobin subunit alpha-like isoform X3 [Carcharodon carcharias]|uniref:hemoglobin subunit alpha-like isoform X3 n=1 Tax=Carcharodon carcharias TaxID=13397 RepID=UPI001B7DB6DD|nr:hemoglobin subunit alpha-like isoform X3 [Carcharodon carcharias]